MPTFGKYETAQRLFLSGVGAIYALANDDKKIVKVLLPPVGIWSDERIQEEIDGFRLRAKIQRNLAKNSKLWAPIHEVAAIRNDESTVPGIERSRDDSTLSEQGRPVASGAYQVMDRYEKSVQSLLESRALLVNADLRAIFTAVFQGLVDLQKSANRPHGALKAANILINGNNLPTATIHLTDPAPDGALIPGSAAKDLADLGRMLYQLVNRKPYEEGTIPRNKMWDAIGPNGKDWRELCNALLDAQGPADLRDPEKLLPKISSWTAKPPKSKAPLIAAAVVVLVIGGSIWGYYRFKPKGPDFDKPAWQTEALTYRGWYEEFTDDVKKRATQPKPDPLYVYLNTLLDKDHSKYKPIEIALMGDRSNVDWEAMVANPNEYVTSKNSLTSDLSGPARTKKGLEEIQRVVEALKGWQSLQDLQKAEADYRGRKWDRAADALKSVIDAAHPPEIPVPADNGNPDADFHDRFAKVEAAKRKFINDTDTAIVAAGHVAKINEHWASIDQQVDKLAKTGDIPLLKKLPELARSIPNAPVEGSTGDVLDDLDKALGRVEVLVKKLTDALLKPGQKVAFEEMARDPKALETLEPTIAKFEALAGIAGDYVRLDSDPRDTVIAKWKGGQGVADGSKEGLLYDLAVLENAAKAKEAGVQTKLDDVNTRVGLVKVLLKEVNASAAMPAVQMDLPTADQWGKTAINKNKADLQGASDKLSAAIQKLFDDARLWSGPYKVKPSEYVQARKDYLQKNTAWAAADTPIHQKFKQVYNDLLKKLDPADAASNPLKDTTYRNQITEKFEKIEKGYQAIENAIDAKVPGLSDMQGAAWQQAIAKQVATSYREKAINDILAKLTVKDDVPAIEDATFIKARQDRIDQYQKICQDTLSLLKDYADMNGLLDRLSLQASEAPAGRSWQELYAKWWQGGQARNELLNDAAIRGQVQKMTERVETLQKVELISEYAALKEKIKPDVPEVALTAWRKLGSAAVTEDLPVLADESAAEQVVLTAVDKLPVDAQALQQVKTRISGEITSQRPKRWQRFADVATTAAHIEEALKSAKDFGVASIPQDSDLYYYQMVFSLREAYLKTPTDKNALKDPAQRFAADVRKLPVIARNDAVARLLGEIDKATAEKATNISTTSLQGPQLAGWDVVDTGNDLVRIFTSKDKKHTLEFRMLSVEEGDGENRGLKTVYVCTTEMPVGLFAEILNLRLAKPGKLDELDNKARKAAKLDDHYFDMPALKTDDNYFKVGIRSWSVSEGKFSVNSRWIDDANKPTQMNGDVYPPAAAAPAPGDALPVQLVSPWAAMYAARLLGCRLPTTTEWLESYKQFDDLPSLPKDVWNLRGGNGAGLPSWRTQQNHALATPFMNFPDKNIYLEDIFAKAQGKDSLAWTFAGLQQVSPNRISQGNGEYNGSYLWFLPVDKEMGPNAAAGPNKLVMHHLVGNVAETVFDGKTTTLPIASNDPDPNAIDAALKADKNKVFVIGGSSLSPPDLSLTKPHLVDLSDSSAKQGFSDVGFRLAYTAPEDSIVQVLERIFKNAVTLPGPRKK